jgi:hypothetical protein
VFYEKSRIGVRGAFHTAQQLCCIVLHSATIARHTPKKSIFNFDTQNYSFVTMFRVAPCDPSPTLRVCSASQHVRCKSFAKRARVHEASHTRCCKQRMWGTRSRVGTLLTILSINTSFLSSGPLCSATITRLQTLRKLYADTVEEMGTAAGTPPASTPKQPRKVRLQQAMHCKTSAALRRLEHGIMSECRRGHVPLAAQCAPAV